MYTNKEISDILLKAGKKTFYLWDKPKPKYDDRDWYILECIKENKPFNRYTPIKKIDTPIPMAQAREEVKKLLKERNRKLKPTDIKNYREIVRLIDGKVYQTLSDCAKENNVSLNKMFRMVNNENGFEYKLKKFKKK